MSDIDNVTPVCTVCIANYNGAKLLEECLDSVLNQKDACSIEIIVHDDASTDDSLALLGDKYPNVKVLASDHNVGFCISNNRMVESARGEFILLLNNDAILLPDAVRTLLEGVQEECARGIRTLPQYDWSTNVMVDRGCLLDPFYNPVPNFHSERLGVAYVIGACLWIPRDLWLTLGGFPEWMSSVGEDLYLCCQARLRGYSVQALRGSGYRHRQGTSFGGNRVEKGALETTFRRRRLSERNKTATLIVCTPTPFAWLMLLFHVIALAGEGLVLTCVRRDLRIWTEIYSAAARDVWQMRGLLVSCRRQTQKTRVLGRAKYFTVFVFVPRKLWLLLRYGFPRFRR